MIKTLVKSLREYKFPTILTPLFVAGETLLEALIPYVISLLVNDIKAGSGLPIIFSYAWKLIALSLIALLFGYLAGIYSAKASTGFSKNLRHDVFENIQNFSFNNIDKFSSASLVTRLTTDIQTVQMAVMMIIRMAVRAPLNIIFSFTLAYVMGGSMALIFLFVAPILFFGLILIIKIVMPIFKKAFPKYDDLNHSVEENILGIRVVKSFVREDEEIKKFNVSSENIRTLFTKAERILALNNPLMSISIYIVVIFVMIVGSERIITTGGQALDIGQFATLLTYSFQILVSLMMLSMVFVMLTFSEESMERVSEVLLEKSDLVSPENAIEQVQDGSIDFEHVSFSYSKDANEKVLEDINVHIKPGEVIGIIGGTGSSKSSLVQLIARLYDVNEGSVKVGGVDVRNYNLFSLREEVAMVLQKNVLFSGTIADNIRWGNKDASLEEVKEVCHLACADEFIDQMPKAYDTWIEQGGTNVSGGQKQRLCIARALLKKPKILILDDSTSAVDTKTDALIRKAMRTYIPETTKIIIAQRTSSVEDADRVIVLEDGRINAIGTSEELLKTNEIYREVYLSQNKQGTETISEEVA
ncbi:MULTISPECIES: ABC transporter ATP-binding protein [Terrabacteria group]|uniref:ABC transporter ATP-binding protein n=1 Tax=Bacillati TaxID=1783272 RepID=UPI0019396D6A|nr:MULTISPECIES: ABC transporter ATP-binding protein [Terrabacteria group]MBW9212902.1 ABC transporter ATP-binding protein/permease [Trueperella sp. zg.1013]QRG86964.1 ABC transporter ATP-binding protein [Bulleidia sp. zg-1006]